MRLLFTSDIHKRSSNPLYCVSNAMRSKMKARVYLMGNRDRLAAWKPRTTCVFGHLRCQLGTIVGNPMSNWGIRCLCVPSGCGRPKTIEMEAG